MATPAQSAKPGARPGVLRDEKTILANQSNTQHSTGPVTAEGKARVSPNATKFGLFSSTAFVLPQEQIDFAQFKADYAAELCPQSPLEDTLAREIVHAAWRLRRCALFETNPPDCADDGELDRLQTSIDRARTTAQRSLHRSLAELRRVQTERASRALALPSGMHPGNPGQASSAKAPANSVRSRGAVLRFMERRPLDPPALLVQQVKAADAQLRKDVSAAAESDFAKQTQSRPVTPANIARSAPCPCGSREKYKRCCGKSAPPILTTRAA